MKPHPPLTLILEQIFAKMEVLLGIGTEYGFSGESQKHYICRIDFWLLFSVIQKFPESVAQEYDKVILQDSD